jgi:hypothetical protein
MITVHRKISQLNTFSLAFNALAQKMRYFTYIIKVKTQYLPMCLLWFIVKLFKSMEIEDSESTKSEGSINT